MTSRRDASPRTSARTRRAGPSASGRQRVQPQAPGGLNRLISPSLKMDDLLREIAGAVARFMKLPAVSFWVVDEPARTLSLGAFSDPDLSSDVAVRTVSFDEGLLGWVATHRQRLDVPDVGADGRAVIPAWWRAHGFTSLLGVPVVQEDRLLAVLALIADRPFELTPEDEQLLTDISAQAASAIRNAELYAQALAGRRESAILAGIAASLGASLDLDEILRRVLDGAMELCGSDAGKIASWDAAGRTMVFRYWPGNRYKGYADLRIEPGKGLGGHVIASGRAIRIEDYAGDPRFTKDYIHVNGADGHFGEMVVPILGEGRVEGLIYVSNRSSRTFSDADEAVVTRLAHHASVALRTARLFEGERRAREEAEASAAALRREAGFVRLLQVVAVAANEAVSSEQALHTALVAVCGHTGWPLGHAWLTRDGDIWSAGLWIGEDDARFADLRSSSESLRLQCGEGLPGRVLESSQPLWSDDLCVCGMPDRARLARAAGLTAAVGFPVRVGDETTAVLEFFVEEATRRDDDLLAVLGHIGIQLGRVTERERAQHARRHQDDQLRQAQKMEAVGQLAGGVAHDFNNLLTVITGRSQLLLRRARENPIKRDVLLIQRTAERAAELTQHLLAYSRKQVLQPRVIDLNAVVAGMVTMFRRLIPEHVDLVVRPGAGLASVKADPGQIEQIITNLVLNARDAMPAGGRLLLETAEVDLDATFLRWHVVERGGRHVVLAVTDTGGGIPPEIQARVFEPFFTTKEKGAGTGLGLATVYGIVKQHGGYIEVESEPGAGTTFRVYLPSVDEPVEPAAAVDRDDLQAGTGTVLVVEDAPEVRDITVEALATSGYTVLAAARPSFAQALAASHPGPIHLLVTDVVMPEMNGRELAERITTDRPETVVLYISGYPDDAIVRHGVLAPGIELLPKPFDPAMLSRRVGEIMRHRRNP